METDGDEAFISAGPPVNRFSDLVGDLARRLKQCCPELGKQSIANFLARAALLGCVSRDAKHMQARLDCCRTWHNRFRPHESLGGQPLTKFTSTGPRRTKSHGTNRAFAGLDHLRAPSLEPRRNESHVEN